MYEETYQQIQRDLKECRAKKDEHQKCYEELEKKIQMLEELIAPFERYFGDDGQPRFTDYGNDLRFGGNITTNH